MNVPNHIAVVMDGNGRWARSRLLPRVEGHRRGIASLRKLVQSARRVGVKHLTVFAFSSENWKRPAEEINTLLGFFASGLQKEAKPLFESDVRLYVTGDRTVFSPVLLAAIENAEQITCEAKSMTLNICVNYGGKWDIVQAVNRLTAAGEPVTEQSIDAALSMAWAGPVDLMIRTGGERRISNFLLWQTAYAELWFTDVLWPDFDEKDFEQALQWFNSRQRRFGQTGEQVQTAQGA